jgi:cytidylate kinase
MPLSQSGLRQVIGSLRTVGAPGGAASQSLLSHWPFVTISREAGTGAVGVGTLLAERLNGTDPPEHPWQCLDRELVERIASDHHISTDLIDSLERSSHTWISEFLAGLSRSDNAPSELVVFRRCVETMRALARAGHVILVGLGGMFITRDMPGGIHVRLVAPLEWRVQHLSDHDQLPMVEARKRVELLDADRKSFFAKFWPGEPLRPECFHLTLNAGRLSDAQMVDAIVALLRTQR